MLGFYKLEKNEAFILGEKKLKFLFRCIKLSVKKFHVEQIELQIVVEKRENKSNK